MNCSTHPEMSAVAFCRACGKALCADCRRVADGTVYCAEHAPPPATATYPTSSTPVAPGDASPPLAFILGLIPGVGAIYNGQYAKGLVHAIIFGVLVSIISSGSARGAEPLFGVLLAAFILYMAFEAYHTARRRKIGERVDEFSSLMQTRHGHSIAGAVTLIVVGSVFLLNTLGIVPMHQILRLWPIALIAVGINMLHSRISDAGSPPQGNIGPNREVNHERQ